MRNISFNWEMCMRSLGILPLATAIAVAAPAQGQVPSETIAITLQEDDVDPTAISEPEPLSNPGLWVRSSDYPAPALREELEGRVGFRLIVGKDGKPGNCLITQSSGSELLDRTACSTLMARARFEPARNAEDEPVIGSWQNAVQWQMPGDAIKVPSPEFWTASYVVEIDGGVSECTMERRDGEVHKFDFCSQLPPFLPYRDEAGNAKRVKIRVMHRLVMEELSK